MRYIFILTILLISISDARTQEECSSVLKGPYLGQKPPGIKAEIFAAGVISTAHSEQQIVFSKGGDELFLWLGENRPYCTILWMKETIDGWHSPRVAPFSGMYVDMKFSFSPDCNTFLFSSNRPHMIGGKPLDNLDIWIVKRNQNGWSQPEHLNSSVNSEYHDYYPAVTDSENLYFMSDRKNGMGEDDIYVVCLNEGAPKNARNIGAPINTKLNEGDPYVAPDESYIIFCSRDRDDGFGGNDLYISYRNQDGSWTKAMNLGPSINTSSEEVCPFVTFDGNYLFFSSNRKKVDTYPSSPLMYEQIMQELAAPGNGSYDIYWINTKSFEKLKQKNLNR